MVKILAKSAARFILVDDDFGPKPSRPHPGKLLSAGQNAAVAPVPAWLRRAIAQPQTFDDAALAAGAAIGALDAVVRRDEKWGGAWRQRLALSAAAAATKQAGRVEDEAALRDAVLLTRPGDDVGPGGRMFLGWRRLVAIICGETADRGEHRRGAGRFRSRAQRRERDRSDGRSSPARRQRRDGENDDRRHRDSRTPWLCPRRLEPGSADALLAQRLGWAHAVPLLGAEATLGTSVGPRRSAASSVATSVETHPERAKGLLAAQARAALRAIDLAAELERRADRLLAVTPKLRAKAADKVVERLLSEDAIVASEQIAGMSDRGLRRLFDRLVELGAVRELSGRPTFRIYGL